MADQTISTNDRQPLQGSGGNSAAGNGDFQEGSFDIMRYLQILLIHKWKFLFIALILSALAVAYALRMPKYYKAEYEIFYNESIKEFVVESNVPVIKSNFDKNFWLSIMGSDEVARLTLENSNLPYSAAIIKRMFKAEMKNSKDNSTPVYKVTVTSKKNEIIPILITAYVKALNDILLKHQINNSEKLISFLSNQLADNNKKLAEIDLQILNSSATPGMVRDFKKVSSDLDAFRTDLLNTQINLSSTIASRKRTESELQNLDGTIVNESAFSEPLKVQLMNLQVDLARSLTKNKEDHPAVKAIRENISQLNNMLRDSVQQKLEIKSLVQNPLKSQLMSKLMELQITEISLQTRAMSLEKVIAEFEGRMLPDTTNEEQQQLLRNRELVFMTINQVNSRLIEAQTAAQGSLSRFVIIDEPVVPTSPANKSKLLVILVGIFFALLLGGGFIFIYDLLDNRLMVLEDYSRFYSGIPVLGTLFHKKNPDNYYLGNYSLKEGYKRMNETGEILVNIKKVVKAKGTKLISVCSPLRREGKSLASLQIADALANKGMNVLLVDMDMFIPKLTRKMGKENDLGLLNYTNGEVNLESIIYPTNNPLLSFTGVGTSDDRYRFQYDSPEFEKYTKEITKHFDVILFDTPAVLHIPDIVTFMDHMDGIVIVARLMHTSRKSFDRLLQLIGHHTDKIIGTVINDLKINALQRYSDFQYYGYEYGYNEEGQKVKKRKKSGKTKDVA